MRSSGLLSLVLRWLVLAAAVWIAAELLPGIHLEGLGSTLAVAAILGLLNLWIRPILFWMSLPLTVLTLGLFIIVLNALLLLLTDGIADAFDEVRFSIDGFWDAFLGAILISIAGHLINLIVRPARLGRG